MYSERFDAMGPMPNLTAGEYILWRGKPKKSAYIADKALSMMPIAIFWLLFDLQFIFNAGVNGPMLLFFLVHMFPVWLWIGSALTAVLQWRNEDYFVTNKRILIRRGVFKPAQNSLFLREVHSVMIHHGLLDRIFGSGDIYLNHTVYYRSGKRRTSGWYLVNLEQPEELRDRIEGLALNYGAGSTEEIHF